MRLGFQHLRPTRSNRYVSLKITLANQNKGVSKEAVLYKSHLQPGCVNIVALYDVIKITGPNGDHDGLIFEPMGPNLNTLLKTRPEFQIGQPWERRFTKEFAKRALLDTVRALNFLHGHGVVHGDLHLGNILTCIKPLKVTPIPESELQQPVSSGRPLNRRDGKKDLWAPTYLLEDMPLNDRFSYDLDPLVKLTDLGGGKFRSNMTLRWRKGKLIY